MNILFDPKSSQLQVQEETSARLNSLFGALRRHILLTVCCIAFGLLLGCQHNAPPPVTAQHPPTDVQRDMATLAFLAYLGDALPASDQTADATLARRRGAAVGELVEDARLREVEGGVEIAFVQQPDLLRVEAAEASHGGDALLDALRHADLLE